MNLTEFEEYNEKTEIENQLFLKLLTSPHEAFRFICRYEYEKHMYILLVFAGISRAFDRASMRDMGDTTSMSTIIIMCVIFGGLFGWIAYYIYAACLSLTGKLLKGKGNTKSIFRVLAYSSVPIVLALVCLIPQIAVYGAETYKAEGDITSAGIAGNIIYYASLFFEVILMFWSIILIVIGLSETQQFSIGKAILNFLLPILIILIPIALAFLLTSSFS